MTPLKQSLHVGKAALSMRFGGSKLQALAVAPDLAAISVRRQMGKGTMTDALAMYMMKSYLKNKMESTAHRAVKSVTRTIHRVENMIPKKVVLKLR